MGRRSYHRVRHYYYSLASLLLEIRLWAQLDQMVVFCPHDPIVAMGKHGVSKKWFSSLFHIFNEQCSIQLGDISESLTPKEWKRGLKTP